MGEMSELGFFVCLVGWFCVCVFFFLNFRKFNTNLKEKKNLYNFLNVSLTCYSQECNKVDVSKAL